MRPPARIGLFLIGWYLMIPPLSGGSGAAKYDRDAPLARWFVYGAYDSAHECEGSKFLNREGVKQRPQDALKGAFDAAQCIATDDPRLK
jgi:hypothetical protein